jgi:succinoglycan biosynthesis protein ExoA
MRRPTVSVIVPCRNEEASIEACLRSIFAQEVPAGGFEIIVADGMSDDGTRDILTRLAEEDPRLLIMDNPGRIVSTALNAAIHMSRGQIIVRMDAHTKYAPDYICQCLTVLRETGADNVGGPWIASAAGFVGRAIAAAFQSPFATGRARSHDLDHEGVVDTVYLGCWPRAVFNWIGLFDEELIHNQDDEFNMRLTRAGGKIWQSPRIKSLYRSRESVRCLFWQYMQYGYWKVPIIQKHQMPASGRHLVPGCFILSLMMLLAAAFVSPVAARIFLAVAAMYSVCNIAASVMSAARQGWKLFLILPLVFSCYHFAYGCGFLRGIWTFVILRRGANYVGETSRRRSASSACIRTATEDHER